MLSGNGFVGGTRCRHSRVGRRDSPYPVCPQGTTSEGRVCCRLLRYDIIVQLFHCRYHQRGVCVADFSGTTSSFSCFTVANIRGACVPQTSQVRHHRSVVSLSLTSEGRVCRRLLRYDIIVQLCHCR